MQVKECVLIEPYICNEEDTIVDVAQKLRKTTLRHIFVVNKESYPVGVISVIDINNRVVAEAKDPKALKAKDIMSKPVEVFKTEDDVKTVAEQMMKNNRVMNPVIKDNKMVGIITINEALGRLEK